MIVLDSVKKGVLTPELEADRTQRAALACRLTEAYRLGQVWHVLNGPPVQVPRL